VYASGFAGIRYGVYATGGIMSRKRYTDEIEKEGINQIYGSSCPTAGMIRRPNVYFA
jgi:hypothetical protein